MGLEDLCPWLECASVIGTFYLQVEPRHCSGGARQTPVLPASSWAPGPTHPTPPARPVRKEAKWPSCSQVPPHPATSGLVPLSAGPCSVAPGPTRSTSFLSRTRLSCPRAASLPKRESPALPVSVSAREALRARRCFTRLLWVWLLQKVWLLALQTGLPGRGCDTGQRGSARQGKSAGGLWPTAGARAGPGALSGLHLHGVALPMALTAVYFLEPHMEGGLRG